MLQPAPRSNAALPSILSASLYTDRRSILDVNPCAKASFPSPACSNKTDAGSGSCADQLRMEPGKIGDFAAKLLSQSCHCMPAGMAKVQVADRVLRICAWSWIRTRCQ